MGSGTGLVALGNGPIGPVQENLDTTLYPLTGHARLPEALLAIIYHSVPTRSS